MDLRPRLHVAPAALQPFHVLLRHIGVAEAFQPAQLVGVLHELAGAAQGQPLVPAQLSQAIGILQECFCLQVSHDTLQFTHDMLEEPHMAYLNNFNNNKVC